MKKLMLFIFILNSCAIFAQSTTETVIAGSRAIIELITIFRNNKPVPIANFKESNMKADSCFIKQQSDLCFKNSSSRDLSISLYRRNDTGYAPQPFTVKILPKKQECLYELRSGIYKYRIEVDVGPARQLLNEGEFKLQPCDNMKREIKE